MAKGQRDRVVDGQRQSGKDTNINGRWRPRDKETERVYRKRQRDIMV